MLIFAENNNTHKKSLTLALLMIAVLLCILLRKLVVPRPWFSNGNPSLLPSKFVGNVGKVGEGYKKLALSQSIRASWFSAQCVLLSWHCCTTIEQREKTKIAKDVRKTSV